jgi:hypothetical protein
MARRGGEAAQSAQFGQNPRPGTFGNTIVSVPGTPLRSLCLEDSDTLQGQVAAGQRLFKIRLVDDRGNRQATGLLVKRRYAWRGYQLGSGDQVHPNRITFSACDIDNVIATISVGLDSAAGLFVDHLYRTEVDEVRSRNRKVCEFTKLAVEASIRSKPVLAALFHIAYIHGHRINRCTDLIVEVNPRHVAFYKQMLGFSDCGGERMDPRVGASAVLLRLDLEFAERQIAELGGHPELARNCRSLYPYFFAPNEEIQIERRLRTVG